jgi:hypothetical protein
MARQCFDRWLAGGSNVEAAPDTVPVGGSSYAAQDIEVCRSSRGMCQSAFDAGEGLDGRLTYRALPKSLPRSIDTTVSDGRDRIVCRIAAIDGLEMRTSNDVKPGIARAGCAAVSACAMTTLIGSDRRTLAFGQNHDTRYPASPDAARVVRQT